MLQVTSARAALAYVQRHPQLPLERASYAVELEDGRINHVYRVCEGCDDDDDRSSQRCLLLKYCPPYVKSLGTGVFPLSQACAQLHIECMTP